VQVSDAPQQEVGPVQPNPPHCFRPDAQDEFPCVVICSGVIELKDTIINHDEYERKEAHIAQPQAAAHIAGCQFGLGFLCGTLIGLVGHPNVLMRGGKRGTGTLPTLWLSEAPTLLVTEA